MIFISRELQASPKRFSLIQKDGLVATLESMARTCRLESAKLIELSFLESDVTAPQDSTKGGKVTDSPHPECFHKGKSSNRAPSESRSCHEGMPSLPPPPHKYCQTSSLMSQPLLHKPLLWAKHTPRRWIKLKWAESFGASKNANIEVPPTKQSGILSNVLYCCSKVRRVEASFSVQSVSHTSYIFYYILSAEYGKSGRDFTFKLIWRIHTFSNRSAQTVISTFAGCQFRVLKFGLSTAPTGVPNTRTGGLQTKCSQVRTGSSSRHSVSQSRTWIWGELFSQIPRLRRYPPNITRSSLSVHLDKATHSFGPRVSPQRVIFTWDCYNDIPTLWAWPTGLHWC